MEDLRQLILASLSGTPPGAGVFWGDRGGGLGKGWEVGSEMGQHTFSTQLAKVGLMPTMDSVVFLTAVCVGEGQFNAGKLSQMNEMML